MYSFSITSGRRGWFPRGAQRWPAFRVRRGSYLIHEPAGGIDSAGPCAQSVAVFSAFFSHMVCLYMWHKHTSRIFFEHPLIYNVEVSWRPRSSACCRNCIQPPRRAARPPLFRQKIIARYFMNRLIYKIYWKHEKRQIFVSCFLCSCVNVCSQRWFPGESDDVKCTPATNSQNLVNTPWSWYYI